MQLKRTEILLKFIERINFANTAIKVSAIVYQMNKISTVDSCSAMRFKRLKE